MKSMTIRVLSGALLLGICSAVPGRAQNDGTTRVDTVPVISQRLSKTIAIPADLTPFQSVTIYAKVNGFLERIDVDRGSQVEEGDVLAVVTAPELRARTIEAEARLPALESQRVEAEARRMAAQSTRDRLRAASATPGVVAGHDLELAERELEGAQAAVEAVSKSMEASEASVRAVREMEAYLELRAPFDGVVTERTAHPGSLVGPSLTPVVTIEQVSRLRLVVPVPEIYVGGIMRGARVKFNVPAFPGRAFEGTVARTAESLDVETRSMLVELDVNNPDGALAPGMYADVAWPVSRAQATLFVPPSAIVRTTERQFVIRVRNGMAEWVDVERGEMVDELIEIYGEIDEGDIVVRRGNDEIRAGARVSASE